MKEHNEINAKYHMKFEDIFLDLLWEQILVEQPEPELDADGNPIHADGEIPDEENGGFQVDDLGPAEPEDGEEEGGFLDPDPGNNRPPQVEPLAAPRPGNQPKKLTEIQKIKMKWLNEQPGLTELMMDEHIQFFKERKERLRPYKPYGTIDPTTNRHYVNLPEVAAQMEKFPDMENILKDPQKIKDIQNYSWEQISFYVNRILNQNRVLDEENFVLGDDNIDQKLEDSYKRWTYPQNRIINENNLIVYKIESKNEAIALGSVQRYIHEKYSKKDPHSNPWCISRPPHSNYGSNMYATYRSTYGAAFYFLMDLTKPRTDKYHIVAIDVKKSGSKANPYTLISRMNGDDTDYNWRELVDRYPGLNGKEQLFKYFGPTRKEQTDFTLNMISFEKGHQYDFATLPPQVQNAYIDAGNHINDVRCFLTLETAERKLYIDKTVKVDDDYKHRYTCDDPNDHFGILEAIRNVKPQDYKYLDFILKEKLHIPQGILAIKLSIVGTNWKRFLSDYDTNYTVCSALGDNNRYNRTTKYGLIDLNAIETDGDSIIKDFVYILTATKGYAKIEADENGVTRKIPYMLQRFSKSLGGGNASPNDYFSFLHPKNDILDKNSPNYLRGKFFDGQNAEIFMEDRIKAGEFIKI